MCETKWKKRPCASVSCSSKPGLYPFIYSYSVYLSLARALSLSFLFWFYPSPANGHPPCLANQKSIKNTSTPSLESYPGWGKDRSASRMLSLSLFLSSTHTHSPPLVIFPLVSSTPRLRPPVYWKLGTWFTRSEDVIYIFFSLCILSFIY